MTGKISWTTTLPDGTVSKFEAESAALNNTDMGNLKSFVDTCSIKKRNSPTQMDWGSIFNFIYNHKHKLHINP